SWSRDIPFEPERGKILDRNDVVLATNQSAPTVLVVPRQIENPAEAAEKLAAVLNMSKEKAYKKITQNESKVYINPEGRKISHERANEVRDLGLKGVYIAEDSNSHYTYVIYISNVLGIDVIDHHGFT